MKAIVFESYGPPDVLKLKDLPKPTPKDDEVLIRNYAATVVAGDCELRSFRFPIWFWLPLRLYVGLTRPTRIKILGQELAGEIEAVGKEVKRFRKGDQVFAATEARFGAYAEYTCIREGRTLAIKPAIMTYEEAAAVPTGGLNALHYLRRGQVRGGEKVLINGAAGNIGTFAVQLAKHHGAEVTGVDAAGKLDLLRAIGADQVIDYSEQDFTETGETYDVIFDAVGKSSYSRCVRSLKPNGRYILANPRLWQMVRGLWTSMISDKTVIFGFARYTAEDLIVLKDLIEAGRLRSVIDRAYPLEQVAEAHSYVDEGRKAGNVAITIGHGG